MSRFSSLLLAVALLTGCPDDKPQVDTGTLPNETGEPAQDADQDGYPAGEDCDDTDPAVHPEAEELCNEVDDDCDGETDEDAVDAETWYQDADGDGHGDAASSTVACEQPTGFVADDTDCDDADLAVHPDAEELCNEVDDDCDGEVDEDAVDATSWYQDGDGDGHGDAGVSLVACEQPSGFVDDDTDCDDGDAAVYPGALEQCNEVDDDCDGTIDDGVTNITWYQDGDGDGYGTSLVTITDCAQPSGYVAGTAGDDCDDGDAAVNPGASEICNGVDDDCDGVSDEGLTYSSWYQDGDGDGYGDASATTSACAQPTGFVADDTDCDDGDAAVNPGATEICNGVDDDCDGSADDGVTTTFYADTDGDGYGDAGSSTDDCSAPSGYTTDDTDCDDGDAAVNPDATELCNGADDDCDGSADEGLSFADWYADVDGDGYGDASSGVNACAQPTGYVADDTDCDDGDAAVNPVATELCNGADDNCDGSIDEGLSFADWYADADGDGYGDASSGVNGCAQPTGYVADDTDCDDGDAAVNPGATELCNGADDNCDGSTDEGVTSTFYADEDGDGYGSADNSTDDCSAPSGYTTDDTDCDDGDAAIYPGATESCDGVDQDCDGVADDGVTTSTWYADADGDGYGDASVSTTDCAQPTGFVADDTDCDDGDAAINPGASEVCGDSVDDDCDGTPDDGCAVMEEHCGTISSNETWTTGSSHLITCDLYVSGSSRPTLTIEDGVEVYVDAGYGIFVGYSNYGKLEVEGGSTGVLFSSSESTPAPGDWDGLLFGYYDQTSELTGATIEYGGGSGYGGIYVYASGPEIVDSVVQYNDVSGVYVHGTGEPLVTGTTLASNEGDGLLATAGSLSTAGSASFVDNVITGNAGFPVVIPAQYGECLDASSSYTGNDDDYVVLAADIVTSDGTWQMLDAPWLIDGDVSVYGSTRPELEIEDGAELYFESGVALQVGSSNYGSLVVSGTSLGVYMSSYQATPAPGDWDGLYFGYYDNGSLLEGLWAEYGGGNGYGAVYDYRGDIELVDCLITDSSSSGFYGSMSFPDISGSSFLDNDDDGVTLDGNAGLSRSGSPSFHGNTMTGNGDFPLSLPANYLGELAADNVMSSNGDDYVQVLTDTVNTDASWRALEAPYQFSGDVSVHDSTAPLVEIEDGAELYFDAGVALVVGNSNYGSLSVLGSGSGVLMSSSGSAPAEGDWQGVLIGYYSSCTIEGLTLEYGGGNGYGGLYLHRGDAEVSASVFQYNNAAGIYASGASLALSDSSVLDNSGHGVELIATSELTSGSSATFFGNTISGNADHPVVLPAESVAQLDASSSYTGNGDDRVRVLTDTVTADSSWQGLEVPLLIDGDVNVHGSARPLLSIEAGAELQFETGVAFTVGNSNYGALEVAGTAAEPVTFTSAESSPVGGDWDGLYLGYYCIDASTTIEHAVVSYAGGNGYGNIATYYCDATISDSTITDSSRWGIYVRAGSPVISGITYSGNALGDLGP